MSVFLEIDGSTGEGGGQILRTSLALSTVLNHPVRIRNIRAGRDMPGLQPQHLTCVNALAKITDAEVAGATFGSEQLKFEPKVLRSGNYRFDVAEGRPSAGSLSLVFQSILLPLAFAGDVSTVRLLGGTHVPWSPPVHYLQMVYLPTVAEMGLRANIELKRLGWYPQGGGEVVAEIHPAELREIELLKRDQQINIRGISVVGNLPLSVARRQQSQALKILQSEGVEASFESMDMPSQGKGTFAFIHVGSEKNRAGFTSLGSRGKRAEEVGEEAGMECVEFLKTSAAIDEHLADQLIPVMALAKGYSSFTTPKITRHLLTNIWVAEQFLPVRFRVEGGEGQPGTVSVGGVGFKR